MNIIHTLEEIVYVVNVFVDNVDVFILNLKLKNLKKMIFLQQLLKIIYLGIISKEK